MDIDLSGASDGRSYSFGGIIEGAENLFGERLVIFAEPVRVEGTYTKNGGAVAVRANIFVAVVFNCDRCLTEVKRDISVDADEVFYKRETGSGGDKRKTGCSASESGAYPYGGKRKAEGLASGGEPYFYDSSIIALDGVLKEKLILAFPEYVVCSPDCRGLCPVCGCDLNVNQCNCNDNQNDGGRGDIFAALK
ncbi:MAG: DUF177 domain-containing protein [Clostridiales bacterium]|jgi:uncharacterized protein|nr:DUF177 domain-containing protein [Clostridiales bacterium]